MSDTRFSVSRRKGQKTFRLRWVDPDSGKRKQHDTGCRLKADADRWLSSFQQGRIPGLTPESLTGQKPVEPVSVDYTFNQLFDDYLRREQPNQQANLSPLRPLIGEKAVDSAGSDDIEKARDRLLAPGAGRRGSTRQPSSVRRYMGALVAAVNWSVGAQKVDQRQADALFAGVKMPPPNQPMQEWLTHKERDAVWFYCLGLVLRRDRRWRAAGVICLLIKTGVRRGAVHNKTGGLTWDRVRFYDEPQITVDGRGRTIETWGLIMFNDPEQRMSNKRRVTAPMSKETCDLLLKLREYNGPQIAGHDEKSAIFQGLTEPAMDKHIKHFRRELGIARLTYKILRTTWASLNVQDGVSIDVVARGLGDDIETTRSTYAHLAPDHMAGAYK